MSDVDDRIIDIIAAFICDDRPCAEAILAALREDGMDVVPGALAESQAAQLAAVRELAEKWVRQMRMCDEAKGQQIADGERILAILDGNQP